MEELRLLTARENPRNLGFSNNKLMPNDVVVQSPMTPIIDRFKAMLKEREDHIRVFAEDDVPPPSTDEIVRFYELVLSELTFNSKPIITDLTIIAGEQREHGEGIADAICTRIIAVAVDQKLPSLYLLDSIVKNIGKEYVRYFSARLPEVFCEAYRQVNQTLRPSMRHLFGTWSAVFPSSVLHRIESQLQLSPSVNRQSSGLTALRASESPRPTHGIHVNPKYLEARRQFENSTADSNNQHGRVTESLKMHGKHAVGHDEYDSDNAEVITAQVGAKRLSSTDRAVRTSFLPEVEKLLPSSAARITNSSSPFGTGHMRSSPTDNGLSMGDASIRVVEGASSSQLGFDYGHGRALGRDEEASGWQRANWSKETRQRYENSDAYNFGNDVELQRPRALIDAYGTDQGKRTMNHMLPKVGYLDKNGIDSKVAARTWQNTEEEEFDWEDMSPTFVVDHNLNTKLFPSSTPPPGSFTMRPGFDAHQNVHLDTDFKRGNWSGQPQRSVVNGFSVEDAVPSIVPGRGLINRIIGRQNEATQFTGSLNLQEPWNVSQISPPYALNGFNAKRGGRNFQVPLLTSAGEQKPPLVNSFPGADPHSSTFASRMSLSGLETLNCEAPPVAVSASTGAWLPADMQKSNPLPPLATLPLQKHIRSPLNSLIPNNANIEPGLDKLILAQQPLDTVECKVLSNKLPQFSHQQAGPISLNLQNQPQRPMLQPPYLMRPHVQPNFVPSAAVSTTSHLAIPHLNHGYVPQGHGVFLNPIPGMQSSLPIFNTPITSTQLPGGGRLPLPPGLPPASSQIIPTSQSPSFVSPNPPGGGAFSGLISSLMAQGLISLANQAPVQDHVGLEFNPDLLKVRHESAITALYADLPRQCTTCGLRFKCQEEHSSHMDWHVTKNRISKNRKQKPSRKWFVSVGMWLSGAEALGADAVPGFLLSTENVVEKKDDEEMAVPADEDQSVCALCGETFDDFYSDETEEWMYKGAVYMNAPTGSTIGMDRSQLGPIVHAKCRSESSVVSSVDFGKNEMGNTEEGSLRKRMRT